MSKVIEHWFPMKRVAERCQKGWGSASSSITRIAPWFAFRPPALCRAAILCSLIEWPDTIEEQKNIKTVIKNALAEDRNAGIAEARKYVEGKSLVDPFTGRGTIPHEASYLGIESWGMDYSPVAALIARLVAHDTARDWSEEPHIEWPGTNPRDDANQTLLDAPADAASKFITDMRNMFQWIDNELDVRLDEFYPKQDCWGEGTLRPWGYLWCITLPCASCGKHTPMIANLHLRPTHKVKGEVVDKGSWYEPVVAGNDFTMVVHEDSLPPHADDFPPPLYKHPSRVGRGKAAVCIFCSHIMDHSTLLRLQGDGYTQFKLLAVADIVPNKRGKRYRAPTQTERDAYNAAVKHITTLPDFPGGQTAIANEKAHHDTSGCRLAPYGLHKVADYCVPRQNLLHSTLCRLVCEASTKIRDAGCSEDYLCALAGGAAAAFMRRQRRTTRGAALHQGSRPTHIFASGGITPMGNDFVETGIGGGPGTWRSVSYGSTSGKDTLKVIESLISRSNSVPAKIVNQDARTIPLADDSCHVVVTDPPYDSMIEYRDSADYFYVWLKRLMAVADPAFAFTMESGGGAEYDKELIVKMSWKRLQAMDDPRTPENYDKGFAECLEEQRRVIKPDGVITVMFGHDSPAVWARIATAIHKAGLVLTAVWPIRSEKGSQMGQGNLETTLILTCRPASAQRLDTSAGEVNYEIEKSVRSKITQWKSEGMSYTDIRVAAYAPALEIVGKYDKILGIDGLPVDILKWIENARGIAQEEAGNNIGSFAPKEFSPTTIFLCEWAQKYGRKGMPKARMREDLFGYGETLTPAMLSNMIPTKGGKVSLAYANADHIKNIDRTCCVSIAYACAGIGREDEALCELLAEMEVKDPEHKFWAVVKELAAMLGESDTDGAFWTWMDRAKNNICWQIGRNMTEQRRTGTQMTLG